MTRKAPPKKKEAISKTPTKRKPTTSRVKKKKEFIKVIESSKNSKFSEMGKRIQEGELKWLYYTIENGSGYHYYEVIKK